MWEKWKDILYDISDILFALFIILMMSTIITWKVTNSLAYSKENHISLNTNQVIEKNTQNEVVFNDNEIKEEIAHSPEENNVDFSTIDSSEISTDTKQSTKTSDDTSHAENEKTNESIVHIEIPSGTPGSKIAELLKNKGLIENTTQFIIRIEERQLASKLKSGSFDIKSSSSLDEIIDIITGKK